MRSSQHLGGAGEEEGEEGRVGVNSAMLGGSATNCFSAVMSPDRPEGPHTDTQFTLPYALPTWFTFSTMLGSTLPVKFMR